MLTETSDNTTNLKSLKKPVSVHLASFSVTAPPQPPKIPRYVLYGKADVDLEWQGYTFRMNSFTWRVHRNNGKIVVIFPTKVYLDPNNKPGKRQIKIVVPTFTSKADKGYLDLKDPIQECIRNEVRNRFGNLIEEYLKSGGVPNMISKVSKNSWQIRPHYDVYRAAERERWANPPEDGAPDPIEVEVVEIYEDEKCIEGKSTKRFAIRGTAHIDLKFKGYTFEIRNLFWGVKHHSYKIKVKATQQLHTTQREDKDAAFITLGFRSFTPEGNKDLHLKIEDEIVHEILKLYAEDIEKRKPEFQHAYEAIQSDVKRRKKLAVAMKKKNIS